MATMNDLDELALAMPHVTKEVSDDGRPAYHVHRKLFCIHRSRRPDALDPETGERLADVLMFRVADEGVKELILSDERDIYFTTKHFDGYPAVLVRIPSSPASTARSCATWWSKPGWPGRRSASPRRGWPRTPRRRRTSGPDD
ncbi:MAG TPA: hypothetical protein VFW14_18565 [Gaiellales bacterium]|nr:hypothetical protein [Gaiellales bacterium]